MIYEALSNIRHNGVTYEAGQIVHELDEAAIKLLLEAKVIIAKEEQKLEQAAAEPPLNQDIPGGDGWPIHDLPSSQPQPPADNMPSAPNVDGQAPAASQPNIPSPEEVAAAVQGQPSPEEIAATAAQIQ